LGAVCQSTRQKTSLLLFACCPPNVAPGFKFQSRQQSGRWDLVLRVRDFTLSDQRWGWTRACPRWEQTKEQMNLPPGGRQLDLSVDPKAAGVKLCGALRRPLNHLDVMLIEGGVDILSHPANSGARAGSVSDCHRGRPDCKTIGGHWHRATVGFNRHRAAGAIVNRPGYPVPSAIRLVLLPHIGAAAVVAIGGLSGCNRSEIIAGLAGRVFGPASTVKTGSGSAFLRVLFRFSATTLPDDLPLVFWAHPAPERPAGLGVGLPSVQRGMRF
jgi:hypothetical protein